MGVFRPTDYQQAMYALIAGWCEGVTEPFPPLADEMPDNGDGEDNLVLNVMGMFTITVPPAPSPVNGTEQAGD